MAEENKTKNTLSDDTVAYYEVMRDAYQQLHKLKYFLFTKILKHMQQHMGNEALIYVLMEQVQKNKVNE